MRQIYNSKGEIAWIGKNAPVPEGWSADLNDVTKFIDAPDEVDEVAVDDPEPEEVVTEEAPKRRGRRRKA